MIVRVCMHSRGGTDWVPPLEMVHGATTVCVQHLSKRLEFRVDYVLATNKIKKRRTYP